MRRDLSPLERVFEYFATQEREGVKHMLPSDLLRALVPTYPPVWSSSERAGNFDGGCIHITDNVCCRYLPLLTYVFSSGYIHYSSG